ncbi:8a176297-9c53-46cb-8a71-a93f7138ac22 [Thermothielavioides terrestris]|uniref:8a176297-9c53-46cb-8a71-a93f7138ac22 n=1 Tax=Thermothielavioides terrestris TaxID=2587410 RepID=A0A3S4D5Q1_9PEZI|nr:8a176297-9c53-46cb-8a71-a93f7138ac22 [Thermothielavioides terrestris]
MGAYVSSAHCAARHGITPNCSVVLSPDNSTAVLLGGATFGNFQGDPDIAGIGVLGAFLSITITSLVLAVISTAWWTEKHVFGLKNWITEEEKARKNWKLSFSGILEALIVTCSDQQVFTGGAYAITLRYAKACSVSAYHYNVVTNMLLVSCATHLMALTISRNYWHHFSVAALRITVTTLLFIVTGVLLANAGSTSLGFPTKVPADTDQYSLMLLPAACFQTGDQASLSKEIEKSLKASSVDAFFSGQIPGFGNYLIMCLFYLIAMAVSLGRIIPGGLDHHGRRSRFIRWMRRVFPVLFRIKRFFYALFCLYLFAGVGISAWTVGIAADYIFHLRRWVNESGWMQPVNNQNPENDPTTFGQLVPVLLMSLTVFTFLQIISQRVYDHHKRHHHPKYTSLRRDSSPSPHAPDHSAMSVASPGRYDHPPADGAPHQVYDVSHPLDSSSSRVDEKDKRIPFVDVRIVAEPIDIELAMEQVGTGGGGESVPATHPVQHAASMPSLLSPTPTADPVPATTTTTSDISTSASGSSSGVPPETAPASAPGPGPANTNTNTNTNTNINPMDTSNPTMTTAPPTTTAPNNPSTGSTGSSPASPASPPPTATDPTPANRGSLFKRIARARDARRAAAAAAAEGAVAEEGTTVAAETKALVSGERETERERER